MQKVQRLRNLDLLGKLRRSMGHDLGYLYQAMRINTEFLSQMCEPSITSKMLEFLLK